MANEYRNQQRAHRTTGEDWQQDAGYSQQGYRGDSEYQGYRSDFDNDYSKRGRQDYGSDYGNRESWRRRNYNEMENDRYGAGFGSGSGNFGSGRYGMSDYNRYMGSSGYGPDYGQYHQGYGNMSGNMNYGSMRNNENDYSYGAYGRPHGGQGFNRPGYGREYGNYGSRQYSNYDQERYRRNDDRDWWDRTTDEVASWFGDEDAERRRRMDEIRDHRGRGPKGYTRSDERIREDINDRLTYDPRVDASDIEVSVNNAEVTLSGKVNQRTAKRTAEDIAESVSGVRNVENRIRVDNQNVDYSYPSSGSTANSSSGTSGILENGKTRTSPTRTV
jgi:osmotically-inducible protein OsmY